MRRLFSLLWFSSSIAFLVVLFASYAEINESIELGIETSIPLVSRQYFFWGGVVVFFLFALPVRVFARLLPKLPKTAFIFSNASYWYGDIDQERSRLEILRAYPLAVGCAINVFLMVGVKSVQHFNNIDGTIAGVSPIALYGSIALLILSVLSAWIRFSVAKANLDKADD